MDSRIKTVENKKIGKVLFVVEGIKDEMVILHKIFTEIFDYQYEKKDRTDKYKPYNLKANPSSSVFVINTKESNIEYIDDTDGYLDQLFQSLINEYDFPVDKAAIFYIFDRDVKSNTKQNLFYDLLSRLGNSRESNELFEQGLLLLSYPCIESFIFSCYEKDSFNTEIEIGKQLKQLLHEKSWSSQKLNSEAVMNATIEMLKAFEEMGVIFDVDAFGESNRAIFDYQENYYQSCKKFRILSLICIALLDLGLIEIEI